MAIHKKNFLIFGSNFGSINHLASINNLKNRVKSISICSPNIKKKNFINKYKIFTNYKKAIKSNFDFVSIATPPIVQKQICNHILDYNDNVYSMLLEKPISESFKETKKILEKIKKKKIFFLVNFIFVNIPGFKRLKEFINKKKIVYAKYKWTFRQKYFENKKKTWKIDFKQGGGIVSFYLIHVIYNLLFFFKEIKLKNIKAKNESKLTTELNLVFVANKKIPVYVEININSNKTEHNLMFMSKKEKFNLVNVSKDWVKNFNLFVNLKKINLGNLKVNRKNLTLENYKLLISKKYKKKLLEKKILISHKICDEILNKLQFSHVQ